jgi:uncharacterized membrane protein YdbT with pleckstrin-like domain
MFDNKIDDKFLVDGEAKVMEVKKEVFLNNPIRFMLHMVFLVSSFIILINFHSHSDYGNVADIISATIVFFTLASLLVWKVENVSTVLLITNRRTILKQGIIARKLTEVKHRDIREIGLEQTFLQRIFSTGKISVSSASSNGAEIEIDGIKNPDDIKNLIHKYENIDRDESNAD